MNLKARFESVKFQKILSLKTGTYCKATTFQSDQVKDVQEQIDGIPIRVEPHHSPIIKNPSGAIAAATLLGWLEPLGALTMRSACCL